jgi:GDPmannose 4,6-dehydratase
VRIRPACRVLLAGSSQMYMAREEGTLAVDEQTPHQPATFYGLTKAWSRDLMDYYRQHKGIFGLMTILFNHESPLRPKHFLTRKVSLAAAAAAAGRPTELRILNIHAAVDWSSAEDIVEGMVLALAAEEPMDYVLASGMVHRVEDVLEIAFGAVDLDWRDFTVYPKEKTLQMGTLIGDPRRAEQRLGWTRRIGMVEMIRAMVMADLAVVKQSA